jgi:hypothetical protein
MGHADRPWLHNAFSLDTKPRSVCLPVARCSYSDPDAHCLTVGYADTNSYSDSYGYSFSNANAHGNTTEDDSDAKAKANTGSAALTGT